MAETIFTISELTLSFQFSAQSNMCFPPPPLYLWVSSVFPVGWGFLHKATAPEGDLCSLVGEQTYWYPRSYRYLRDARCLTESRSSSPLHAGVSRGIRISCHLHDVFGHNYEILLYPLNLNYLRKSPPRCAEGIGNFEIFSSSCLNSPCSYFCIHKGS